MNRKGLSEVLETMIMIVLVIVAISIVWVTVNSVIRNQLKNSACFNVADKVTLNSKYTCYDESNDQVHFSVTIGDLDVQDVLVSITTSGQSSSFKIKADNPSGLEYLNGTKPLNIDIPAKNSGLTYIYQLHNSVTTFPDSIEIAPIIDDQQCGASVPIDQIDSCALLAG